MVHFTLCAGGEFAGSGTLVALNIPGWPRAISVDLLWNKKAPPGSRELAASAFTAPGTRTRG
jgi:hypothetical protein